MEHIPPITPFLVENGNKLLFPLKGGNSPLSDYIGIVTWRDRTAVERLLRSEGYMDVSEDVSDICWRWSRYSETFSWAWNSDYGTLLKGTLTKRLSKLFYEAKGKKIPPELLTRIGNIAARGMLRSENLAVDFTNVLNWDAGDFGDDGSCFWGEDHWSCRGTIENAGGYAMRYYRQETEPREDLVGCGRAWMVPDTPDVGCATFFNVYGQIGDHAFATLAMQTFKFALGIEYNAIMDVELDTSADNLYINSGQGFVICPQERYGAVVRNIERKGHVYLAWADAEQEAYSDGRYEVYDNDDY